MHFPPHPGPLPWGEGVTLCRVGPRHSRPLLFLGNNNEILVVDICGWSLTQPCFVREWNHLLAVPTTATPHGLVPALMRFTSRAVAVSTTEISFDGPFATNNSFSPGANARPH